MQNPIHKSDFFVTPASLEELFERADSMGDTAQAYQMLAFTMNYCHSLVEREIELAKHPKQYKLVALEPARPIWR
jgi:hypothetical protein